MVEGEGNGTEMKQTFYTPFLGPPPKPLKLPPPCDRRAFIRWFLKAAKYTANEIFEKPDLELTYMTGRRPQHAWWLPQIADATTEVSQMLNKHEAAITRIKDKIESFIKQGQQRMIPAWLAKNRSVLAICGHHEHYPGITEEQRWVVVGHFYIAGDGVCLTAFGTTIGFCPLATRDAALEVLGEFNGQSMQQQGRAIIDFMETHGHPPSYN